MTDYFQGVVAEYLRADRSVFVNSEILIQLDPGLSPRKGRFWYCDLLAVSMRERVAYLCEVTYASSVSSLIARLRAWQTHWAELRSALERDCSIESSWHVAPWVFLPESRRETYERKLSLLAPFELSSMPEPKVTVLEDVVPWKYRTWDRQPDV